MTPQEGAIALNLTHGIGAARARLLMETFGSADQIFQADKRDLMSVKGINEELASAILENGGKPLEEEMTRIQRSGVRVFIKGEEGYPAALDAVEDAPLCLYVCGKLPEGLPDRALAVVGSRRATAYGIRMARFFSEAACYSKWTVISGLALGIDTAAHKGALAAEGVTLAVLGGGLMKIQPAENLPLAREILEKGGAVITEFPMTFTPARYSFPMRNRIISALSSATLVVEAGTRSGALITAATALEQGKSVFAVPGNADSEMSAGCNELIRSGNAALAVNFEDILAGLEFLPGFSGEKLFAPQENPVQETLFTESMDASLPESDRKILDYLRQNGDSSFDAITAGTGETAVVLSRKLISLELSHRIQRNPDGTYRRLR